MKEYKTNNIDYSRNFFNSLVFRPTETSPIIAAHRLIIYSLNFRTNDDSITTDKNTRATILLSRARGEAKLITEQGYNLENFENQEKTGIYMLPPNSTLEFRSSREGLLFSGWIIREQQSSIAPATRNKRIYSLQELLKRSFVSETFGQKQNPHAIGDATFFYESVDKKVDLSPVVPKEYEIIFSGSESGKKTYKILKDNKESILELLPGEVAVFPPHIKRELVDDPTTHFTGFRMIVSAQQETIQSRPKQKPRRG